MVTSEITGTLTLRPSTISIIIFGKFAPASVENMVPPPSRGLISTSLKTSSLSFLTWTQQGPTIFRCLAILNDSSINSLSSTIFPFVEIPPRVCNRTLGTEVMGFESISDNTSIVYSSPGRYS